MRNISRRVCIYKFMLNYIAVHITFWLLGQIHHRIHIHQTVLREKKLFHLGKKVIPVIPRWLPIQCYWVQLHFEFLWKVCMKYFKMWSEYVLDIFLEKIFEIVFQDLLHQPHSSCAKQKKQTTKKPQHQSCLS